MNASNQRDLPFPAHPSSNGAIIVMAWLLVPQPHSPAHTMLVSHHCQVWRIGPSLHDTDVPLAGWQYTVSAHDHDFGSVIFSLNLVVEENWLHKMYYLSKDNGQSHIRVRNYYMDETQCGSILKYVLTKFLRNQVTWQAACTSHHSTISIPNCWRVVWAWEREKSWGIDTG